MAGAFRTVLATGFTARYDPSEFGRSGENSTDGAGFVVGVDGLLIAAVCVLRAGVDTVLTGAGAFGDVTLAGLATVFIDVTTAGAAGALTVLTTFLVVVETVAGAAGAEYLRGGVEVTVAGAAGGVLYKGDLDVIVAGAVGAAILTGAREVTVAGAEGAER